ncbi:MAG TPA: hypothetical protein DCZ91_09605 [Lachnospiraceae bacterium]|nr:hypothetical protein [Lachnospiraceae bacterium]
MIKCYKKEGVEEGVGAMSKFEKRFGKYAISNLSLILILCYVVGYVIELVNADFLLYLTLNPYAILHGQIWRIFTWIIIPPSSLDPFTIIMLLFYYNIGTSLERTWGTWRYNVYLLSGMFFTVLGSFVWLVIQYFVSGPAMNLSYVSTLASLYFSTYYINMSIFLAFAATFPEVQVLLMFIIPVKVKWMGILYGLVLVYDFLFAGSLVTRIAIASSLLSFVIFFFTSRNHIHMSPKQMKRRAEFRQDIRRNSKVTKHKCAICGQTEDDDPTLEFRFCSKCNGNYEYCQQHLFTHTHVQ